jgi:glycogen(starch) synthase
MAEIHCRIEEEVQSLTWKPTCPVLMTADPIGGVWTYVLELCRELKKADVNIALATMGRRLSASERIAVRRMTNVELFESDYKLEWMREPWHELEKAGDWLLDLEACIRPSLVHLNEYCHGALRWRVPCLIVGHSCVLSWFEFVKAAPAGDEWQRYKHMVALGLRDADLVTAPSRFMLSALRKIYGGFAAADPIYNGRRPADFPASNKEPLIFTAGRLWDEAKNIIALRPVAGDIPWPIYAAGESRSPDGSHIALDGLIELGRLDSEALARWYARASIFVLPARYEPFGLSVLEAALAGCALVLGDIPSLREIWTDAAVFVPPDDPDRLRAELALLIQDSALRDDFSQRALARASSLTSERMGQQYLQLYQRLLARRSQRVADDLAVASSGES